ncbi:MAG: lysophospholipid acyltransferase family protein [Deltaproteobacteria bacterium]|nr:lysophospholipid acyltransferase family protein [Deltaproteobacteria bacterium]
MKDAFYQILITLSNRMGLWVFRFMAWFIASGYFFLFPGRVAISLRFYRALFPSRGLLHHLWCAWRQYHNFVNVYMDRFLIFDEHTVAITHEGWELLEDAVNRKAGGIILMSHVGNWEIAAHMLKVRGRNNQGMKLLLYLGQKHKDQIERTQKESLVQSGIKIIVAEEDTVSPADIIEGINFLKAGGLVSLTGDRIWRKDQRSLPVRFLGHEAFLPETPFIFALLSGTPLYLFFAFRTGKQKYHFQILPPQYVHAQDRNDRQEAIGRAAQLYADRLLEMVRQHPFEWYHFEPFIGQRLDEQ